MTANCYISQVQDPYLNLGIEDWLFRHVLADEPLLLLWQNTPCVVIGRAQNPWLECNVPELQAQNIPIVRRQSGGGTVYHDLDNLNISFLMPRAIYQPDQHIELVQAALTDLGIPTTASQRRDLFINHQSNLYKILGSAFRETRSHAFHHMSLLIDANVEQLWQALTPAITAEHSKGVASVRREVMTLKMAAPHITLPDVKHALQQRFAQCYGTEPTHIYIDAQTIPTHAAQYAETIAQWDWIFGKTLPFSFIYKSNVRCEVEKGVLMHPPATEKPCLTQRIATQFSLRTA